MALEVSKPSPFRGGGKGGKRLAREKVERVERDGAFGRKKRMCAAGIRVPVCKTENEMAEDEEG